MTPSVRVRPCPRPCPSTGSTPSTSSTPVHGSLALASAPSAQDLAVSYARAADLEGVTLREIRNRVAEGLIPVRPSGDTAPNGRPLNEIVLGSLSPEARARYVAQLQDRDAQALALLDSPRPDPEFLSGIASQARGPASFSGSGHAPDVDSLRVAGAEKAAAKAAERREVLAVYFALAGKGGPKGVALAQTAAETGVPVGTLRRWLRRWRAGGALALAPAWGSARGSHRSIDPDLQGYLKAAYATPQQPTARQLYRNVVVPWSRAHYCPCPSYVSVLRFIDKEVAPATRVALRTGRRAWQEQFMAMAHRDWAGAPPNAVWCADHRRLDLFVLSPTGAPVRPWVTMFEDCATAGIVGTCLRERPSSQTVALALRAGIMRYGVPQVLYIDNGKEFTARRFGGRQVSSFQSRDPDDGMLLDADRWPAVPPAQMETQFARLAFAQLGIERTVHAIPYSSWSKPIESVLGAFARRWENMLPGWCGNSPQNRHERLKADIQQGRLLTWDDFARDDPDDPGIWLQLVSEWNNNHVCGDRRHTPAQRYEAAEPALRRAAESDLDFLLLKRDGCTVPHDGIAIGANRYLSYELAVLVGHRVAYSYDPDRPEYIVVRPLNNPAARLVVPALPSADPLRFGPVNVYVQSLRKTQRQALAQQAAALRPYQSPAMLDPTGAWRTVAASTRSTESTPSTSSTPSAAPARAADAPTDVGVAHPLGAAPTDVGLMRAALSQEVLTQRLRGDARRKSPRGVGAIAAQINAQAESQAAYDAGAPSAPSPPSVSPSVPVPVRPQKKESPSE